MLSLIQLVTHANVIVSGKTIGAIQQGILALIGIEKTDTNASAEKMVHKIINYRIFPDANGKTNLSLKDVQGGLLLVPQFTLVADTQSGTRPSFSTGMEPSAGKQLFAYLIAHAKQIHPQTECGEFGAYMQVNLCNDGPMTFLLASKNENSN